MRPCIRARGARPVDGAAWAAAARGAAAVSTLGFGVAALGVGVALLVTGGCLTPAPPPPKKATAQVVKPAGPLCTTETTAGADKSPKERVLPAQNWFVLMLHAYRSTGEIARPLADCSGTIVKMETDGCTPDPSLKLTPTALTPQDLVVTPLGDNRRLVWVITERVSDGQAQGPVAIATVEPHGLAVQAMGVLRAYPDNASLRLEKVSGSTVLVVDGQRCGGGGTEGCERGIRIVPLAGNRFASAPLVNEGGTCLSSSLLQLRTKGQAGSGSRGPTYELEASVTIGADAISVRENLAITRPHHARQAQESGGESFVSRLQLERSITVRDGHLISDGPSLLTKWLAQQADAATAGN